MPMSVTVVCVFCDSRDDLGRATVDVSFTWRGAVQDGEREVVCCRLCAEEEGVLDGWAALEIDRP